MCDRPLGERHPAQSPRHAASAGHPPAGAVRVRDGRAAVCEGGGELCLLVIMALGKQASGPIVID